MITNKYYCIVGNVSMIIKYNWVLGFSPKVLNNAITFVVYYIIKLFIH